MEQDNLIGDQNLFQWTGDIPEALLKDIPCIQNGHLADGEIRAWNGPRHGVLSPVWVAGGSGSRTFYHW